MRHIAAPGLRVGFLMVGNERVESVMLRGFCNTSCNGFLNGLFEKQIWLGIARRIELCVRIRAVRNFSDPGTCTGCIVHIVAARRLAAYSGMAGLLLWLGFVQRGNRLDLCRVACLRGHAATAGTSSHH